MRLGFVQTLYGSTNGWQFLTMRVSDGNDLVLGRLTSSNLVNGSQSSEFPARRHATQGIQLARECQGNGMIDEVVAKDARTMKGEQMPMEAADDGHEIHRILHGNSIRRSVALNVVGTGGGGSSDRHDETRKGPWLVTTVLRVSCDQDLFRRNFAKRSSPFASKCSKFGKLVMADSSFGPIASRNSLVKPAMNSFHSPTSWTNAFTSRCSQ